MSNIDKNLELKVCDLYKNTILNCYEIADQLKIRYQRVYTILKRNNLNKTARIAVLKIHQDICNTYQTSNLTEIEIAEKFNTNWTAIRRICKENNIPNRGRIKSNKQIANDLKCNENFFENIDSIEKAWVLGFITSDSYIDNSNTRHRLIIDLCAKDLEVLEKIKKYMECEQRIIYSEIIHSQTKKQQNKSILSIYRKKIYDDLIKLGLEDKSSHVDIPKIPDQFMKDYLRGIFCGDGGFFIDDMNNIYLSISTSAPGFLEQVRDIFEKECEVNRIEILFYGGCYRLKYGGNNVVRKIFKYLYPNPEHKIFLERKYNYARNHFDNLEKGIKSRNKGEPALDQYEFGKKVFKERSNLDKLLGF